jgi:hypothetical protein
MSIQSSKRTRALTPLHRIAIAAGVAGLLLAGGLGVVFASVASGENHTQSLTAETPTPEPVDPALQAARDAAAETVRQALPLANSASGVASPESIATMQADVAALDTASRIGSELELTQASVDAQASLLALATSAADTCEARLAAGVGGAVWAAAASDDCAAVRAAVQQGGDLVGSVAGLIAVGPAA